MQPLIRWEWPIGHRASALIKRARQNPQSLLLDLSCAGELPITAVVSEQVVRMLQQRTTSATKARRLTLQQALLASFEGLIQAYRGADLDVSVLVEPSEVIVFAVGEVPICVPVVLVWCTGTFGAFAMREIPLDEDYWIERILFQTELKHSRESQQT
jgi:hypothetical protein